MTTAASRSLSTLANYMFGKPPSSESFADNTNNEGGKSDIVVSIVVLLVMLSLVALLGKFLWNEVMVKMVTVLRPAPSMWHILGLYFFVSLFS